VWYILSGAKYVVSLPVDCFTEGHWTLFGLMMELPSRKKHIEMSSFHTLLCYETGKY